MKAWKVRDKYDEYSFVVFAETRNKAKYEALLTDYCEDMDYIEIRAKRYKEADTMYRGKGEMDWFDPDDRRFLVEHGWVCELCEYTLFIDCTKCSARDICELCTENRSETSATSKGGLE